MRRKKPSSDDPYAVGLPGASAVAEKELRKAGIDPDRLPILHLGRPGHLLHYPFPPWIRRIAIGFFIWFVVYGLRQSAIVLPDWLWAGFSLVTGLIILQGACEALISASERMAQRLRWNHYTAGTVMEILSTLPELAVIAFIVPVSPLTAFVLALITIYNNALVFSLYSFFLPKNQQGRFLMPNPITEAGTKILIAGAAIGLVLGLLMLGLTTHTNPKTGLQAIDLYTICLMLFVIFAVYLYKLLKHYASEEEEVRETLDMNEQDIEKRIELVYQNVQHSPVTVIMGLFCVGVFGAVVGGESVAHFAEVALDDLALNSVLTALILAIFAGMSEYVILWKSHRKKEYGIALANAFGGITQVMFLVLPFTLLMIAINQEGLTDMAAVELPIQFTLSNILLLIFLFPTLFLLAWLIKDDHTLDILDATIMSVIFILLILLLVTYGANGAALQLNGAAH